MKLIAILITLLIIKSLGFGQTNALVADKVTGWYWSPKKDAKIEVFKKGDKYFGVFKWTAGPAKDTKNPNKALQERNLVGIEFLSGFSYNDGSYTGGRIYDPHNGKTYDCKMFLNGDNLQVRGFIGLSLFGRTEIFERIK